MDKDELKALYLEVVRFLHGVGGAYRHMSGLQCARILRCLDLNQYLVRRDAEGKIIQFVGYWLIREQDIPDALEYRIPTGPGGTITDGSIVHTVDYGSVDGVQGVREMFTRLLPAKEPQAVQISFNHFSNGKRVLYTRTDNPDKVWKMTLRE